MTKESVSAKGEQAIYHLGSCYLPRSKLALYICTWHGGRGGGGGLKLYLLLEGTHFTWRIKAQSRWMEKTTLILVQDPFWHFLMFKNAMEFF